MELSADETRVLFDDEDRRPLGISVCGMSVTAAAVLAEVTADEIAVEQSLGKPVSVERIGTLQRLECVLSQLQEQN